MEIDLKKEIEILEEIILKVADGTLRTKHRMIDEVAEGKVPRVVWECLTDLEDLNYVKFVTPETYVSRFVAPTPACIEAAKAIRLAQAQRAAKAKGSSDERA